MIGRVNEEKWRTGRSVQLLSGEDICQAVHGVILNVMDTLEPGLSGSGLLRRRIMHIKTSIVAETHQTNHK